MRTAEDHTAISLKIPLYLHPAIKRGAELNMMSAASYVRGAVLSRLKSDGVALEREAAHG